MLIVGFIFQSSSPVKHIFVDILLLLESFSEYKLRVGVITKIVCLLQQWNIILYIYKWTMQLHMYGKVRQLQTKNQNKPPSYELI